MRVLGIDYGQRRIGLALSDPTGLLARPWKTVAREGNPAQVAAMLVAEIAALQAADEPVEAIVLGFPRRLNGDEHEQSRIVRQLADSLRRLSVMPLHLQDERLSSREADARLARGEKDWRKRKAALDAASAAVILQDYLDSRDRTHLAAPGDPGAEEAGMKRIIAVLAGLVILASLAVGLWVYRSIEQPYKGFTTAETFVEIPPGTGTTGMAARLAQAGVVRSETTFKAAVWMRKAGRRLQAGEYRFDRPLTPAQVVDRIARGDVYLRPITFREGLTIRQMAALFEEKGFGTAASFISAASNPAPIRTLDPDAEDLEGYLFPDTYSLPRRATAETLVARMVGEFQRALTPEVRDRAMARGLGLRQLVTLASIVEKETGQSAERPLVAAVYSNRLKIGMGLQCDPTVIYALERAGRYDGNIRKEDLSIDSPYNTYRYAGLPPGPIAAPGKASLEAAASPASAPYLYFVSRNDGSHAFASTLDEHNRNVRQFQVQYFRDRRAAGAK